MFDLTKNNSLIRKTDETINVVISNSDNSPLQTGDHVFYFTIRKVIPPTSQTNDDDVNVVVKKTVNLNIVSGLTATASFFLSQADLDIDPKDYFYDIKWTDTLGATISLTQGYARVSVKADITRRNV
jgi:hypothetical protein